MILFSSPKPFTPETLPVQVTAIRSWKRALPKAQVVLFGNEPGLDAVCRQEEIHYGGQVESDENGREILSGIFRKARGLDPRNLQIYVNSDILLDESAATAVASLESFPGPFLATARRRCLSPWTGPARAGRGLDDFLRAPTEPTRWGEACALDIFLFREFPVETMPNFLIGHAAWDNWMIFQARCRGIPAIDLSRILRTFHCDHDYSYSRGNPRPRERNQVLDQKNLELLGGESKKFHLGYCDHEVSEGRVVRRRGAAVVQRQLEFLRICRPWHRLWILPLRAILRPWVRRWERATTRREDWNQGVPPA